MLESWKLQIQFAKPVLETFIQHNFWDAASVNS